MSRSDVLGEPESWHCGGCRHTPPVGADGLTRVVLPAVSRRRVLQATVAGAAMAAVLRPGRASAATAPVHTTTAVPGDALFAGTWVPGDTHVHTDHSSDGSATRQGSSQVLPGDVAVFDQIGQGVRIGLGFMPITDHRTYDQVWDPLWTSADLLLMQGEEANGSPHAIVLGNVDEIVDGGSPPGSAAFRHIQQSVWEAHAQGAVWSTAHPDDGETNADRTPNDNAETVGVNLVEVWNKASTPDYEIDYAENRWNAGWRFGGVGGCDCHFRELWGVGGPGMPTTWVLVPSLTERGVLDGLGAGRTSVSATPVGAFVTLEADLDGDGLFEAVGGDEVTGLTAGSTGMLRVRLQLGPAATVIVYQAPGRAAATLLSATATGADQTWLVPFTVPAGESWFRVEVRMAGGPSGVDTSDPTSEISPSNLVAIASPVFTSTGGPANPQARLPVPTQTGRPDGLDVWLGKVSGFAGFGDVAAVGTGLGSVAHVVGERHVPAGTTIVYRRFPDGAESALTTSAAARFPRVAASGDVVHVVWQDERAGQMPRHADVWLRTSTDGGTSWLPEQQVSTSSGRSERPDVAVDPADPLHPWVVWADNQSISDPNTGPTLGTGSAAFDVHAVRLGAVETNLSAAGKTTSPGTPSDARSPRWPASLHPAVRVGPTGRVVVSWQDDRFDPDPLWTGSTPPTGSTTSGPQSNPDQWEPMVVTLAPGASTWSALSRVAPDTAASARHPQVVAAPDGRLVAVWSTKALSAAGANLGLLSAVSTDDGVTWSPAAAVDPAPEYMQARPRLGVDPDGSVRVVWADTRNADWRWRTRTALLRGSSWVGATDLSQQGNGTFPAVDGGVVVLTTDRNARVQKDRTQQVALTDLRQQDVAPALPDGAPAVLAAAAALGVAAVTIRARGRSEQ